MLHLLVSDRASTSAASIFSHPGVRDADEARIPCAGYGLKQRHNHEANIVTERVAAGGPIALRGGWRTNCIAAVFAD